MRSRINRIKKEEKNNTLNINKIINIASQSSDFAHINLPFNNITYDLFYYESLIDSESVHHFVLPYLNQEISEIKEIKRLIPLEGISISSDAKEIEGKLLQGHILLQLQGEDKVVALLNVKDVKVGKRIYNDTENEYSVVGPKTGFVEDIQINLNLLRNHIVTSNLIFEELTIGSTSKTKVMIAYLQDITNEQYIQTIRQRLQDIDFDVIFDATFIEQLISDNTNTPFPLFLSTERVDRAVYTLINGQVVIFSDGSPYAITGPSNLFDFFISPEDYYLPWVVGSFFRLIRIFGVLFSTCATSIYVAVLTYHYTMIPKDLMGPLVVSRANVPFPPVLEVLFLEITIELLREAGARLPTKVGQTLGIVGGIVIGQASVAAALTSNVLLIIVALSALASFTTPIFKMSNTIRLLRIPLIILAGAAGGYGLMFGLTMILIHLLRLTSLGTPYLLPFYPFRKADLGDTLIRSSYSLTSKRASYLRPKNIWRYNREKAHLKKDKL
ncbi:spore germination protein [Gottfriedia solisilvae]|uniref:Spore germination protein n=1 Tax=Gottfriedia solisilvae TaxID=1516104 RepID=A0A8J3AMS2_9BACI|nr:spore germination protein [Gottfriedia solisilvae]GGI15579.1 spore germination protein [Gottfriedia solisilvae]